MRKRIYLVVAVGALVSLLAIPGESAPGEASVRFTAAGDFSASTAARAVFAEIGAIDPDAHFALGDLSYGTTGAEQAWCDAVLQGVGAGFPFELISGNHESDGQNGNINDFSACLPNQLPGLVGVYGREYYVDVPRDDPLVRFVMISPALTFPDGTWTYSAGSAHYQWTVAAIDGARAAGIPWVVVGTHKPCLSLGNYGCETSPDLQSLLLNRKVDLVLSGHEHLYQRTKQLALRAGCASVQPGTYNAACVVDADSDLVKGAGTVFATVGTGGTALRALTPGDPEAPYFVTGSGSNQNPTFGVLDVQVTAVALVASFERASGGTFTDSFTIAAATSDTVPPTVPTGLTQGAVGQTTAAFSWTASTDNVAVAGYHVYRGANLVGTVSSPATAFSQTGLTAGTAYSYSVSAFDGAGNESARSSPLVVTTQPAVVQSQLVAVSSVWRYLDTGVAPASTWRSLTFNDSAWKSGPAELGADEGDEATTMNRVAYNHAVHYARQTFQVPNPGAFASLTVSLLVDDGAVVYLNGTEVLRDNMPTGTVTNSTRASTNRWRRADETAFRDFTVPASALVSGTNVIAVSIHNAVNTSSSDVSFNLGLRGVQ